MVFYIRNMVCNRCRIAVKAVFEQFGIVPLSIELGEVDAGDVVLPATVRQQLNDALLHAGFELIDDRKGQMIEKIKNLVVTFIHHTDDAPRQKYSDLISAHLHLDYGHISKLFSAVEGMTIEQYIINQKVEKIKEYLVYDELTLSEIADSMGYSSVAHLSAQFKKVTGFSPAHLKQLRKYDRRAIDEV
jgi:AraC-like DNA-binding protein